MNDNVARRAIEQRLKEQDPTRKRYLGDSVYVEMENGMLKLTTDNGYEDDPRNVIYLEQETYQALVNYVMKK